MLGAFYRPGTLLGVEYICCKIQMQTISVVKGNHHVPATKSTLEWHTKEDTGKSIKNALQYAKGTSRAEVMSNSKKINPVALGIVKLRWSEGIRQAVN